MPARLILNADDFGLTPGINRAVLELFTAGVLTSATLMATGPAFADAVERLQTSPGLGVGCHVCLVDAVPVSSPAAIPSLLGRDRKNFRPALVDFVQAVLLGRLRSSEVELEAEAQIRRLQAAGVTVTHVDTHKHTHALPQIARALGKAAARCGVPAMRFPFEPGWSAGPAHAPLVRRIEQTALHCFAPAVEAVLQPFARLHQLPHGTLGIAATGTLSPVVLRATLAHLVEKGAHGTFELCCHPGHVDRALEHTETRLRASRELEREALLEVIPDLLDHPFGPRLIHYGDLGTTVAAQETST